MKSETEFVGLMNLVNSDLFLNDKCISLHIWLCYPSLLLPYFMALQLSSQLSVSLQIYIIDNSFDDLLYCATISRNIYNFIAVAAIQ